MKILGYIVVGRGGLAKKLTKYAGSKLPVLGYGSVATLFSSRVEAQRAVARSEQYASDWGVQQNHPELVVRDCVAAFGLTEQQAEELRKILMLRGVNKWLLARRRFIRLKHNVKDMLKTSTPGTERHRLLQQINTGMQHIAKMPRWVEWPRRIHSRMERNEAECIVRGRPV